MLHKMKCLPLTVLCCIFVLLAQNSVALKCHTGNQYVDDQFQKILQICRRRQAGHDFDNDNSSTDESNSESSSNSDEDTFNRKFGGGNNRNSTTPSSKDRNNWYRRVDHFTRNMTGQYNYSNYANENSRNVYNYPVNTWRPTNSNQGMRDNMGMTDNMGTSLNSRENYNGQQDACIIQCLFNELNVVDKKGFPEKQPVIQLMTQNVRNPELQDFIEESITECFHFLNSDTRKEKCNFSRNLLSCVRDKEKERCEDWGN